MTNNQAIPQTSVFEPATQLNLKALATIALSAAVVTLGIFVGMHKLIENKHITRIDPTPSPVIILTHNFEEEPVIERTPIKPLPKPIEQPEPLPLEVEPAQPNGWTTGLVSNTLTLPSIKPNLNDNFGNTNSTARPIVRIEPKYPVTAARDGIEGWVELSFSISASGEVEQVTVINAEPRRIFDKAAKRALSKWKYKPSMVAGKAVAQDGLSVRLDFKLDA